MDMVNNPKHYNKNADDLTIFVRSALLDDVDSLNLECIEAMTSCLSITELRGYFRGNSFKYRWRYTDKAGIQDLEKAAWYEKKLLILEKAVTEFNNNNNNKG